MSFGLKLVVVVLLASGASVRAEEKQNEKPNDDKDKVALITAASRGKTDEVLALLKKGVSPNSAEPDKNGKTCLIRAIMSKQLNTVKALLENGADVHRQDGMGRYPVYFCHTSTVEILQLVLSKGGDKDVNHGPLIMLASLCDHGYAPPEMIPILIEAGADPNLFKGRVTPLIAAITLKKPVDRGLQYVKALIANKADVNLKDTKEKMSPLQWAKMRGDREIIEMLEKAGAKD